MDHASSRLTSPKGMEPRMIIRTCKHILDRGVFCRAPAMNKRDYCHAHLRLRQCGWRMARAGRRMACLKLPLLVDMSAVRTAKVGARSARRLAAKRQLERPAKCLWLYCIRVSV